MDLNLLLAVAISATLLASATSDNFAFYKLSLIWPTSACNTGAECKLPIPKIFTIHGLWPQFANDSQVPPYDKDKNKCNVNPTSPDDILVKLQPIEDKLKQKWPSLRYNKDENTYWKIQWQHHGMCSQYPTDPLGYFTAALTLADKYNPLDVMGIKPADKTLYQVKKILEAVKGKVGKYPQISCNMLPKVDTLQLREIRFCFEKGKPPTILKDCPKNVDDRCTSDNDYVRFPPASPLSTPIMTWDFASSSWWQWAWGEPSSYSYSYFDSESNLGLTVAGGSGPRGRSWGAENQ